MKQAYLVSLSKYFPKTHNTDYCQEQLLTQKSRALYKFSICLFIFSLLLITSCATRAKQKFSPFATPVGKSGERFNVQVFSNGKKVDNHNIRLVHRLSIKVETLESVFGEDVKSPKLGFETEKAIDRAGAVYGFKVISDPKLKNLPKFGLTDGDIVTAIGNYRPQVKSDMEHLYTQLKTKTNTTLTFIRAGKHHKIFYFLTQ